MSHFIKTEIKVGQNVAGAPQVVPVFSIKGKEPGPKVYIQANLHGAEIQGNAVIYQLLHRLKSVEIRGQITLVPLANPVGLNQKAGEYTMGRFDPVTGANWNRMYFHDLSFLDEFVEQHIDESDEQINQAFAIKINELLSDAFHQPLGLKTGQHVCYALQQMAQDADYVIDLHTGPMSAKHLYVPEYALESAKYFNVPNVLIIPNGFDGALDEACFVPWWSLSEAFAKKGRTLKVEHEAFTYELGSQETISMSDAQKDVESIFSYLSYKNMFIDDSFAPADIKRYTCTLDNYRTVYAPRGGLVEYHARFGEILPAGSPLASMLNVEKFGEDDALYTLTLDKTVLPILYYSSGSVYQGAELYKVFYDFSLLPNAEE